MITSARWGRPVPSARLPLSVPERSAIVIAPIVGCLACWKSPVAGGGLNIVFTAGRELAPWCHEPWVQEISDRLFGLMTT
ncbi:hypothetical protein AB0L53_23840 [Nonomuraea sp. NPDC052129]|uniref:hypothetical protein n=1 Tax=Nonomuraea sp. NPDC052129 TaxID=3154651 RepID=UPI003430284D